MPLSVITSSADTYVNEALPNQNFGQLTFMRVRGSGTSHRKRGVIYFKLPNPLESLVLHAKLHLRLRGSWGGTNTITVDRIIERWGQNGVTWNRQPNQAGLHEQTGSVVSGSDKDEIVIDITDMIQDATSGQTYFGLQLSGSQDNDRDFYSSDASSATMRPSLEVKWSNGPAPPSNLSPAGGRIVAPSQPVLRWKFNDDIGEAFQAYSHVQISTSSSFTSPVYDSGFIGNNYPYWDLSAASSPSFTALSPGDIRWWRVRVKDDSGLISPWSDAVSFERQPRGVLTLTNPAVAPNDFVDELTPPLSWTFTTTPTKQEVILYEIQSTGGPGILGAYGEIYRWANVDPSARSVHVPLKGAKFSGGKFPGLKTGRLYNVVVRVWDEFGDDREGTPGDPQYQSVNRTFHYVRQGAPSPVTSLHAVVSGPSVILTFQRATQPDFFGLRVDQQDGRGFHEEEPWIVPTDVFVSGTTYTYVYWGATIGQATIYEVEAAVSSTGVYHRSNGNATVTATTEAHGVWIVDPDDNTALEILEGGGGGADIAIGSQGTTYEPLGARKPVRIIDNVRGFEGTVSGVIKAAADRDVLTDLYGRQKELRLILWDLNIPMTFDEPPSISHIPEAVDQIFAVSFSFFQSGEFADTVPLGG